MISKKKSSPIQILGMFAFLCTSCANTIPNQEPLDLNTAAVQPAPEPTIAPSPPPERLLWMTKAAGVPVFSLSVDSSDRHILMADYAQRHYGVSDSRLVDPEMIIVHTTAIAGFKQSFNAFKTTKLTAARDDIKSGGDVNVGVHFLVAPDGTLAQLLPLDQMGRHAVGYNHVSFGIELVGRNNTDITAMQIDAVTRLIVALHESFPSTRYLIGHHEYMNKTLQHFTIFRDLDDSYIPPKKVDPGARVMAAIRHKLLEEYETVFLD